MAVAAARSEMGFVCAATLPSVAQQTANKNSSRAKAQRRKGRRQDLLCVFLCVFAPLREKFFSYA